MQQHPSPFLTTPERIAYLEKKKYLFGTRPSDTDTERLGSMNFHYFLGYARNYRSLVTQDRISPHDVLHHVLDIVELDHELAVSIYRALRTFEWKLRNVLVESFCTLNNGDPTGLLLPDNFIEMAAGQVPLPAIIRSQLEHSREPFLCGAL